MECYIRNRTEQESLGWQTLEDIDWQMVRQLLRGMLRSLLERVAGRYSGTTPVTLGFHVHVDDSIDIGVYEVQPDGRAKIRPDGSTTRLSDSEWYEGLSPLDSSFYLLSKKLSEEDAIEAAESVIRSLKGILSDECKDLAKDNFHFPASIPVSWIVTSS